MGALLIQKDVIDEWLKITRKNQLYLAQRYNGGVGPSYMSRVLNNGAKYSADFVGWILDETKINYYDLFQYNPYITKREFYGSEINFNDKLISSSEYRAMINTQIKNI